VRSAVAFYAEYIPKLRDILCERSPAGTLNDGAVRGLQHHVVSWKFGDVPALREQERKALVETAGLCAEGSTIEIKWSAASSQDAARVGACFRDSGWTVMQFQHKGGVVTITACKEKTKLPEWKQKLIDSKREQRLLPADAAATGSRPVFSIEVQKGESLVLFRDSDASAGGKFSPPVLGVAVRNMTHYANPRVPIPISKLHRALGRLRAIAHECSLAARPAAALDHLDAYERFARARALEQLQGLGCSPAAPAEVEGLSELIEAIESHFADGIEAARAAIRADKIGFWHLGELYKPGARVCRVVHGLCGARLGMMVKSSWYEDHKTIFGSTNTSFHITCEFVASVGGAFAVCTCDEILSDWTGPRRAADLDFVPLDSESSLFSELTDRGAVYGSMGVGNHFVECRGSGFMPRATRGHGIGRKPTSDHQTARVMVDVDRGIQNFAFGIPDSDSHTLALLQSIKAFRQIRQVCLLFVGPSVLGLDGSY
jgi:hypothetical protein